MAEAAGPVRLRHPAADPARRVRIAADAADLVAAHAELPGAVAARAGVRIAPRGGAVIVALAGQAQPAARVGARAAARHRDALAIVTGAAAARRVARGAHARIGARLLGVPGEEARAVDA